MKTRRDFLRLAAVGATAAAASGCRLLGIGARAQPFRWRTITYNVLACQGWSKEKVPKPSREVIHEMFVKALGSYGPDLITFQESPGEDVVKFIAEGLGMNWTFFPSGKSWPGGVITRHPIVESKNCPIVGGERPADLFTRHWGRAVIEAPFGPLILHSAHLHPGDDAVRTREVTEVLKAMQPDLESGGSLIFQGDLNHTPEKSMYGQWTEAGLIDTFAVRGSGQPYTIKADAPNARIDYVWAHGPIADHIRETRVLFERPFRTDPDDPTSWALSDHLPVMADFR